MQFQMPRARNAQCLRCGEPFDVVTIEAGAITSDACGHDITDQEKAIAWEQGYAAGQDDENYYERGVGKEPGHPHPNPYVS